MVMTVFRTRRQKQAYRRIHDFYLGKVAIQRTAIVPLAASLVQYEERRSPLGNYPINDSPR